jgi:hypothetical protein
LVLFFDRRRRRYVGFREQSFVWIHVHRFFVLFTPLLLLLLLLMMVVKEVPFSVVYNLPLLIDMLGKTFVSSSCILSYREFS